MAHVTEFKTGDTITFTHKGATVVARITKFNKKTVKAEQLNSVSVDVKAAFGRPARTKHIPAGGMWSLGIRSSGSVSFVHADEKLAAESKGNTLVTLEKAILGALRDGMDPGELFVFVSDLTHRVNS